MQSSFKKSVIVWRRLVDMSKDDSRLWSLFEKSEIDILSHHPTSPEDAVAMLEVLIDQSDGRSDGRDLYALKSLKKFMEHLNHIGLVASRSSSQGARMTVGSA